MQFNPISINTTATDLKNIIESLYAIGEVSVSKTQSSETIDFTIEYLTNAAPVPNFAVHPVGLTSSIIDFCLCENSQTLCSTGLLTLGCSPSYTRKGSIITEKLISSVEDTRISASLKYEQILVNLTQSSAN